MLNVKILVMLPLECPLQNDDYRMRRFLTKLGMLFELRLIDFSVLGLENEN
jgi:hypothetical protein